MRQPRHTIRKFYVALLLVCIAVGYCSLEIFFHVWSIRYSQGRRILMSEYRGTLGLRPRDSQSNLPTMLLAGNSLLEHAVDLGQFQRSLSAVYRIQRFAVPATTYEDWHYILNDIFRRGSRPQFVVLLMSPMHLALKYPIPDLAVVNLYRGCDLGQVASEQLMSLNDRVMLYITHYSPFWGSRESIRYWKQKAFPGYAIALRQQSQGLKQNHSDIQVDPRRLQDLASLCAQYNSQLVLVVPPTDQPADAMAAPQVLAAAAARGIPALLPLQSSSIDSSYYDDGLHLNAKGAQLFTSALADALREPIQRTFAVVNQSTQLVENQPR
jgi:hypothetical protein